MMSPHTSRHLVFLTAAFGMLLAATEAFAEAEVSGNNGQTVNVRPMFKEGRTARYKIWSVRELRQKATFGGQSRSSQTKFEVEGEITWSVEKSHKHGAATCSMMIDWITYNLIEEDGEVRQNDSRKASGDIERLHAMLVAITATPLKFEVTEDGTVESVAGTDAMRDAATEDINIPEDLDFIETAADLALLAAAPADASIGDDWTAQFIWSHESGKMHHDTTYSLNSVENLAGIPITTVDSKTVLSFDPDVSMFADDGPQPTFRMTEGGVESQIIFDLSRHETVGRNSVENHTIEMAIEVMGRSVVTQSKERIHSQVLRIAEQ